MPDVSHRHSDQPLLIIVGICTYRRPHGLQRLLQGLAGQTFTEGKRPPFEILIVDNEGSPETERICAAFRATTADIPLTRVVELRRGISQARNTLLDNVPSACDYLAMIDDDECPSAGWLDSLLATQQKTGAEIVRGPVSAVYSEAAPAWVVRGEYFGWPRDRPACVDGQVMSSASTGNTLVKMACIRRGYYRFDPGLALSGGEDTVFFDKICEQGCLIVYSAAAMVEEFIPPERTTLAALLRLSYRNGNNRLGKHLRMSAYNGRPARVALFFAVQGLKSIRDICTGVIGIAAFWLPRKNGPDRLHDGLLQIARGFGQLTGLFGLRYQYYR